MTAPSEIWVQCGEIERRGIPKAAEKLLIGPDLSVDIGGIDEKLMGRVRPVYRDLIRLAAYVLAADGLVSRGRAEDTDFGRKWHRNFHFVVGVECLDAFNDPRVTEELERTLGLLSDDTFTFEFRRLLGTPAETGRQLTFSRHDGKSLLSWDHVEEVMLFSGGLDSLAGAADATLTNRRNVILVSHNSGTKTWKTQRDLVGELRQMVLSDGRRGPDHVAISMARHERRLRTETTQRTRSFLYAAFAGAVADVVNVDRIRFYENGVMALHVPKSPQLVGARGTRTAHPRVLEGIGRLLSLVGGKTIRVENPFLLKTRAEVLADLGSTPAAPLIRTAVSCAQVSRRPAEHAHCGVCSQCVDRWFSTRATGLERYDPDDGYAINLVRGARPRDTDRMQLLAYIGSAFDFKDCSSAAGFLSRYGDISRAIPDVARALGDSPERAHQSIFELHQRHGKAVAETMGAILKQSADEFHRGSLPATSLPSLFVQGSKGEESPVGAEDASSALRELSSVWFCRFRGGKSFELPKTPGLSFLAGLLGEPSQTFTPAGLLALHYPDQLAGSFEDFLEGMDAETLAALRADLDSLRRESEVAEECDDQEAVRTLADDILRLESVVERASSRTLRRRTTPLQADAKVEVCRELEAAIRLIRTKSWVMAKHIERHIRAGYLFWHRSDGISWNVIRAKSTTGAMPTPDRDRSALSLEIDLTKPSVRIFGREVPMSGPYHLQRMPLYALAALAAHPGKVLSQTKWIEEMVALDPRLKDGQGPDRHLVRKIRSTLIAAIGDEFSKNQVQNIVETIYARGYRLNLPADRVHVIHESTLAVPSSPSGPRAAAG